MRLTIVFTVMNQFPLATLAIDHALDNLSPDADVELLVIDNGSDTPFEYKGIGRGISNMTTARGTKVEVQILRHEKSIGVYPTFWDGIHTGDVIAFFHSDLVICEQDWDKRVLGAFESHPKLGLLGFIGSNEIDGSGGRGLGTMSNFQGNRYVSGDKSWSGSAASVHGKHVTEYYPAAVVDGCAMIFSHSAIEHDIQQRENFPPHHFYDKLISCEVREAGYEMAVLGIACDHISGQTVNQEGKYQDMAQDWCDAHGIAKTHNWDDAVYHESERQWLTEYRDTKHLIPCKV